MSVDDLSDLSEACIALELRFEPVEGRNSRVHTTKWDFRPTKGADASHPASQDDQRHKASANVTFIACLTMEMAILSFSSML